MASKGVNKVILIGNLGKDPEVRYFPSGDAVANTTLATTESWKDKQSGEWKDATEWHNIVLPGKLAEIAGKLLKKGSKVYIEGSIRTRKWQDKEGKDRYTTEIRATEMQLLDSSADRGTSGQASSSGSGFGSGSSGNRMPARKPAAASAAPAGGGGENYGGFEDDSIPF